MALIQLRSTNPKFSYVIQKNPATGLTAKPVRLGQCYGYFTKDNPQEYNLFFQDSNQGCSFGKEGKTDFQYLDPSRYVSSVFLLSASAEMLATAMGKDSPEDTEGYCNELIVPAVALKTKYVDILSRYYPEFQHTITEITPGICSLIITTKAPIRRLLAYANILMMFNALQTGDWGYVNETEVEKYLRLISYMDAPYFIRYLFKLYFFRNRALFDKYQEELSKSARYGSLVLKPMSIHEQRKEFVRGQLSLTKPILDIGCGEGDMMIAFARKMKDVPYLVVDKDPEMLEIAKKRAERKELTNVKFFSSVAEACKEVRDLGLSPDILMTEVVEHMAFPEAKGYIHLLANLPRRGKIIITTPCADFNVHFNFHEDEESRHEDHKWEASAEEWKNMVAEIGLGGEISMIGDLVDGIGMTQALVIPAKEEKENV